MTDLPAGAYAAGLARLPGIGPARLTDLLRGRSPGDAWACVQRGEERRDPPQPGAPRRRRVEWDEAVSRLDLEANWQAMQEAGIRVTYLGCPLYPGALRADPEPPGVLYWSGDLATLDRTCVAVVGTRRCTSY